MGVPLFEGGLGTSWRALTLAQNMPRFSGIELLERVIEHALDVPVLLMSADHTTQDQALAKGSFDYINKPLSRTVVLTRISHALESYKSAVRNQGARHGQHRGEGGT